jgi:hypothetical protein
MRRLMMMAGALGVTLLMSTGAFAQVPADPANPNEAIPETMAPPAYGEPINLETAKKVAAAARAEVDKRKWRGMCIAVVGPTGDLVYFGNVSPGNYDRFLWVGSDGKLNWGIYNVTFGQQVTAFCACPFIPASN